MSHRHVSAPSRRRGRRFLGIELVDESHPSQSDDRRGGRDGPGGPDGPDGPDDWDDEFKPKKSLPRRMLKWLAICVAMFIVAAVGVFFLAYSMIDIPNPNEDFTTETTTVYYSDGKHVLGTFAIQNREEVSLSDVPKSVQDAVISAEDRTFWDNAGIDVKGIIRAAWSNARSDSTQGASTITQQYVKVLYLTQDRTWSRKLKEAILSLKVQRQLSKQEVLQGYLNTIYFGRGAYGIQAAAEAYFQKNVQQLDVSEAAALAAVLNSPGNYDPAGGKDARRALLARYQYVLDGMADMGNLDPDKAAKLSKHLPKFPKPEERNALGGQRGFLMDMVEAELKDDNFSESQIYGGGLKVITTFDWKKQRAAQQVIKAQRKQIQEVGGQKYKQLHMALTSVEPGTGAVRALYAGHNYLSEVKNAQFNWATHGVQPGSSFKPFAIAAALENGYTLDSDFDGSSPYHIDATDEDVENQGDSGGSSYGPVSLLYATERSINTAFVDLTLDLGGEDHDIQDGANKILQAAQDAGIPKDVINQINPVAVTALGYAPVPAIDMADAYATFAAKGQQADWYTVQKVTNSSGEPLVNHQVKENEAFPPKIANDVTYALQQVIDATDGTGYNAQIRCPAAGKTGTATAGIGENTHVSSSWFVGYTPQLATAVTFSRGDFDGQLDGWLDTFYGGEHPAETWQAYMSKALKGQKCEPFPKPSEPVETTPTEPTETTPTDTEPTDTQPTDTEPTQTEPTKTHPTHPTHPTETTPTETTPTQTTPTETTPTCTPPFCPPGGGGGGGGGGGQPAGTKPTG